MKNSLNGIKIAEEFIDLIKAGKSDANINNCPKINEFARNNSYYNKLKEDLTDKNSYKKIDDSTKEDDIRRLLLVLNESQQKIRRRKKIFIGLSTSIAAVVAVVSFLIFNGNPVDNLPKQAKYTALETFPKSNYDAPILLLSDGSTIDINANAERELIIEGTKITKAGLNTIVYSKEKMQEIVAAKISYNTLIIPKMQTFTIKLADGTEVTLNANSELRYPTHFTGNVRDVYLKGEAYFKVKKGDKPFIVNCLGAKIQVYGTIFNVSANNANEVNAVLVEGSIGGYFTKNNGEVKEMKIKPNEMLTINFTDESLNVREVDSEAYTAWMMGYFRYDSNQLRLLLEEISMWYDVEFYFENEEDREHIITCSFDKGAKLDYIINSLQKITNLKFEKKGDDYIIR